MLRVLVLGAAGFIGSRPVRSLSEPLNGNDTVCPVAPDTPMPFASVNKVVKGFLKLHDLPRPALLLTLRNCKHKEEQ